MTVGLTQQGNDFYLKKEFEISKNIDFSIKSRFLSARSGIFILPNKFTSFTFSKKNPYAMNRLIALLLFIVVACNHAEQKPAYRTGRSESKAANDSAAMQKPTATAASFNPAAEVEKLNSVLKQYETKPQTFTVSGSKKSEVKGRKGTLITVDPAMLETTDGKPLGKKIEVDLKEVTNAADFVYANSQTVSDGKLLVSGGAYKINMTSDGSTLRIKQGKTLSVRFPRMTDDNMELFYGQRDSLGQMNWKQAREKFVKKETEIKGSTTSLSVGSMPASRNDKPTATLVAPDLSKRDGKVIYQKNGSLMVGDTMSMTKAERKKYLEDVAAAEKKEKTYDELYNSMNISSLGWINCDRFLNINSTDLIVEFPAADSIESAKIFVVFKSINSVISINYFNQIDSLKHTFSNMPIDYKAKLIALTMKGDKAYADAQDIIIEKDKAITLHMKETSAGEFKKLLSSN
jgi:hypothetical protein